ncbi:MAG: helix-turn-helix domain-containing protein, partial [Clostridia bacterium]|nr:helix-turn-helix domain-containing protein [Clostridia bacterium]
MVKKSKGYFKVDRGFFELRLRPHTAMVYLYLLSSINKDTRQCWPSMKTIARKLNISKSTVEKAIVELERRALIIKSNRSCDSRIISNLYTLPDGIAYYHREGKDEFLCMVPPDSHEGGAAGTGGQEINKEKELTE